MEWLVVLGTVAVLGVALVLGRRQARFERESRHQPNELERQLAVAARTQEISPELARSLMDSQLFAFRLNDTFQQPMTQSMIAPQDSPKGRQEGWKALPDGRAEGPKHLFCFSSRAVMEETAEEDELMAGLFLRHLQTAEFTGRQVMEHAVEEDAVLAINPYFGTDQLDQPAAGMKISVEAMRTMLSSGRMPE